MTPQTALQQRTAETGWRALPLLLVCMRPHQWTKNLFVLAPLLFGRKLGDMQALLTGVQAFVAFCLASSALYILNDIMDAPSDREHPAKRWRPIASGALPVSAGLFAFAVLTVMSVVTALRLSMDFLLLFTGYFALVLAYSFGLKRVLIVDALAIACGFVLRVTSGAVVINVPASHWLIACAFLLALYLAFAKRRQELMLLDAKAGGHRKVLGEYSVKYLEQVNNILLGAAIVCYALYTVAPETVSRFGTDALIYGTIFVVYGLLRYMVLIQDGLSGGDPSSVAVSDRPLLAAVSLWAAYNAAVIYRTSVVTFWERLF